MIEKNPTGHFINYEEALLRSAAVESLVINLPQNDLLNFEQLAQFPNLRELHLPNWNKRKFPSGITKLKQLTHFSIFTTATKYFPEEIWQLTHLKSLSIGSENIRQLPDEIGNFHHLESLELRLRQPDGWNPNLWKLKQLRNLTFGHCWPEEIPEAIGSLPDLETLSFNWVFPKNWRETLLLPESIGELRNLRSLNIQRTGIGGFPDSLCACTGLQEILVEESPIRKLPELLGVLHNLETLKCSLAELETLPESLKELQKLYSADFRGNQLTKVPFFLAGLKRLKELDLSQNYRLSPAEILKIKSVFPSQVAVKHSFPLPKNSPEILPLSGKGILRMEDLEFEGNLTYKGAISLHFKEFEVSLQSLNELDFQLTGNAYSLSDAAEAEENDSLAIFWEEFYQKTRENPLELEILIPLKTLGENKMVDGDYKLVITRLQGGKCETSAFVLSNGEWEEGEADLFFGPNLYDTISPTNVPICCGSCQFFTYHPLENYYICLRSKLPEAVFPMENKQVRYALESTGHSPSVHPLQSCALHRYKSSDTQKTMDSLKAEFFEQKGPIWGNPDYS